MDFSAPPKRLESRLSETAAKPVEYAGFRHVFTGRQAMSWTFAGRCRLLLLLLSALPLAAAQSIILRLLPRAWWYLPYHWHRLICFWIGLSVEIRGELPSGAAVRTPRLYVANHISWLDIFLLGGYLRRASFIAKSEISGWGIAAWIVSLQRTIFVNREKRSDSARQRNAMMDRLVEGDSLIMFPEGTSTDGVHMAPFKSSLFSVAEQGDDVTGHRMLVQPISIAYVERDGLPLLRAEKPFVAWLGDMELLSHVRDFLCGGHVRAVIEFHPPVHVADVGDRKKLAAHCEAQVRAGLERANRLKHKIK